MTLSVEEIAVRAWRILNHFEIFSASRYFSGG